MSRLTLAAIQRSDLRCRVCNKRLNCKTVRYKPHKYPAGIIELVPVCNNHAPKKREESK